MLRLLGDTGIDRDREASLLRYTRHFDLDDGEFPLSDRFAETGGTPANDDGGEQAEASHAVAVVLARQAEAGRALRIRSSLHGQHCP